jgi:hypothetical protein
LSVHCAPDACAIGRGVVRPCASWIVAYQSMLPAQVKCEGGVPCDRCFSRMERCDLVGGFGHYTEFLLSPDGGLGAVVDLVKACFKRQFAHGGMRRAVALNFMCVRRPGFCMTCSVVSTCIRTYPPTHLTPSPPTLPASPCKSFPFPEWLTRC